MFKYSSRFWLYAPTALFLLLAAAVMIYWWMAAGALEKKLAALKGRQAIPGVTLDWSSVQVGGFPFRLDADFIKFRVQGAGAHGPFSWSSEKFAAHALTYGRRQTVYEAAGRQQVNWSDERGNAHAASFLPGSMRASSILDGAGLKRFDLDIVDMGDASFTIGRFQFHMRRGPNGSDLDLMARIENLHFGRTVDIGLQLSQVYATVTHASSLDPLLRGEETWPQAIANWRKTGGTVRSGPSQTQVRDRPVSDPQNIAAEVLGQLY